MISEYDMTGEEYDILYKRYLKRDPKELLELAGMKEGDRVLDLCSGANGRASKAAVEMGASYVAAVDLNPMVRQLKNVSWAHGKIEPFCEDVYGYCEYVHVPANERFDVVICQQGINYWFNENAIVKLRGVMGKSKHASKFVFNTFKKKPNEKPTVREYDMDGRSYVEVAWMIKDKVCHVQVADGYYPHFTEFKWLPLEKIKDICEAHFEVEYIQQGNTDIYVCTKNPR
jgi:ubiquinone/menaquinone biosynthesis C-methylase UbiE